MYLRQVTRTGVLGLIGYLVLATGFLLLLSTEVIAMVVLPTIAGTSPGYVTDVLAVAVPGGHASGDIGLIGPLSKLAGIGYLAGGLLFGIALFRANILARWAAALLAVGAVATLAIPLVPQVNFRLFAIPTGVAMVGLGYSLWRDQHAPLVLAHCTSMANRKPSQYIERVGAQVHPLPRTGQKCSYVYGKEETHATRSDRGQPQGHG